MKINKILKAIDITIENEAIRQGLIIYFCRTPHLDPEFFGSHMMVVDSKDSDYKSLCSTPMHVKNTPKVLEIINDINQELSLGCVTLAPSGDVCYSCSIFLPQNIPFDYAASMTAKIVLSYEYMIPVIWDRLNAGGVLVSVEQPSIPK